MRPRALTACFLACILAAGLCRPDEPASSAERAREVLQRRCFACHGQNGAAMRGIFVLDRDRLVSAGVLKGGDPQSPLLRAVETGVMPPGEPLPEAERESLRRWVREGAPDWDAPAKQSPRAFLTEAVVSERIERDLDNARVEDRPFLRYFTLAHLYNAGVPEAELDSCRIGLAKLLNSLSWQPEIAPLQPIDPARTLLRLDLRALGWAPSTWRRLLAEYPYGLEWESRVAHHGDTETRSGERESEESPTPSHTSRTSRTSRTLPGPGGPPADTHTPTQPHARTPILLRADWFAATASRPPLYHDLLGLPGTVRELETLLGLDTERNLREGGAALRAGMRASGVSQNNRVVERHPLPRGGAYWRSYDFNSSQGDRNIFRNPLDFHADGGEMIFNLPNGMQAYFIADRRGRRLDQAPVGIVADRNHPEEPEIVNGRSCMGCHTTGMKSFRDEVRAVAERLEDPPFDRQRTLALYAPPEQARPLLEQDSERFRRAVEKTGGRTAGDFHAEPIAALARRFAADLSPLQAAAELGLELPEFRTRLARSRRLAGLGLGQLLLANGGVRRDVWEEHFAAAAVELGVGEPTDLAAGPQGGVLLVAADESPTGCLDGNGPHRLSAERFVRNIASFFTRGRRGRFLIYSACPAFGKSFEAVLVRAGHQVSRSRSPLDLDDYDGIFTGGDGTADPEALARYVETGGKVYLAAGTGDIPGETTFWNGMLRRFGLRLWSAPPGRSLDVRQFEPGPLFRGVAALPTHDPDPIALLPGEWPGTRILSAQSEVNWWALYTTAD